MKDTNQILNGLGEQLDTEFHVGTRRGQVVVVLGHGLTGNKDRPLLVAIAEGLSELGWSCLRFSFSGNGDSEGDFRESNISKEITELRAVLEAVPQECRLAYVGHSMGGAVGVMTAASCMDIQALVSLAGMTHTADFVSREFGGVEPGAGLMWDEPDCPLSQAFVDDLTSINHTLEAAAKVMQPWLLIHGTEDEVIPLKDSEDGFSIAQCRKELVKIEGAGHVFGEDSYALIVSAIDGWLRSCFD